MIYDLSQKDSRKKFVKRCNDLLNKMRTVVSLTDESDRTLNQNSYVHVLCRIMAEETGQTDEYAKQVYFKELANPDIFITVTKDPITGKMIKFTKSSANLTIKEMARAIGNFIKWAAEQGYELPEAESNADGTVTFSSQQDENAFHQAELITSKD